MHILSIPSLFLLKQWEALALLLIGISVNQLKSLPEGTTALGLPVATGAYIYTLVFVSHTNLLIHGISVSFSHEFYF